MASVTIESTKSQYLIRIDKSLVNKEYIHELMELLQIEDLAQQVDIDESIMDLGEDIKTNWWRENKSRFIDDAQ